MKTVALALTATILSVVVGLQLLAAFPQIPDGNRLLVIGSHMVGGAAILALPSSLVLIAKAHRNLHAFLRAFIIFGVMASLGNCSHWIDRFHGPARMVTHEATGVQLRLPSDWQILREAPDNVDFAASDWAGTSMVGVTTGARVDDGIEIDDDIERLVAMQRSEYAAGMGDPIESFTCGAGCAGDVFAARSRGKDLRVYAAMLLRDRTLIIAHGTVMVSTLPKGGKEMLSILGSIQPGERAAAKATGAAATPAPGQP
jgi:hypothetical protein